VKRLVNTLGTALTAILLSAGVAAAASLGLGTGELSAGHAAVVGCTSSALTAIRNVDNSGDITRVSVLDVPQACAGETLAVTLEDSSHTSLAGASTAVGTCSGGCTVTIPIFGTVPAARLAAYALSLTG
jgi:hypothetical protein